jgi:putative Mg2+ transporter-C (MgtC) family protein
LETIRIDPTHMAQGIMTGIGFLGAGVIYQEEVSIHGLTTAASIWITAAIGILVGVGLYLPAMLTTALVLGVLSAFRWIETRMPSESYVYHYIRFDRNAAIPEEEVRAILAEHGFTVANMSYRIARDGPCFE